MRRRRVLRRVFGALLFWPCALGGAIALFLLVERGEPNPDPTRPL